MTTAIPPSNHPTRTDPSPWRPLTITGLVVLGTLLVAIQLLNRTFIPPVSVFAVAFVGLALALWRWAGRRTLLTSAAAGLVLVVVNLPAAVEDLSHPESLAGFVPTSVAVLAGLVVAVSGVLAATGRAAPAARPMAVGAVALLVVGTVASGIASASVVDDDRGDRDVEVAARAVTYPEEVSVGAGRSVLFVDNQDLIRHTLLIEGTAVDVELPGAASRRVPVDLAPGSYRYYCDIPGHEAMAGTLEVSG